MVEYINTKWVIWNELKRLLALPVIRLYFLGQGVPWGKNWRILGTPIIQKSTGSQIKLGDNLILRSWRSSNPVAPYHPVFLSTRTAKARILIGEGCGITGGSIIATNRVEIGNRTLVGGNCLITDTDFHPLNKDDRHEDSKEISSQPVFIGSDVFIGTQTIILKGSTIGEGSVVGAGSVVSGEIPANVVAAGNPAKVLRHLHERRSSA